jgi:hypothetical protein
VALTLPEDAIQQLRKVHRDIAWAVVTLLEKRLGARPTRAELAPPVADLVTIAGRQSLIVVDRNVFRSLPGINIIPLNGTRAFLALDVGGGMPDLELAVLDKLEEPLLDSRERRALETLRGQLKTWRRDRRLRFHARTIIVVEHVAKPGAVRRRV